MSGWMHLMLVATVTFLCLEVAVLRKTRFDWAVAVYWAGLLAGRVILLAITGVP